MVKRKRHARERGDRPPEHLLVVVAQRDELLRALADSPLVLSLVGSRFLYRAQYRADVPPHTDWDFLCCSDYGLLGIEEKDNPRKRENVDRILTEIGFKKKTAGGGYQDDGDLSDVYTWEDPSKGWPKHPSVDVLCAGSEHVDRRLAVLRRLRETSGGWELAKALKGNGYAWSCFFAMTTKAERA